MFSQLRTTRIFNLVKHLNTNQRNKNKCRQLILPIDSEIHYLKIHARNCVTESNQIVQKADSSEINIKTEDTFASLLRHSAFMQIGNPVGKVRN